MGYNIDSVATPVLDAWMYAKDVLRLYEAHKDNLPESTFLGEMRKGAVQHMIGDDPDAKMPIENLWWQSECSGNSYDRVLKEKVAPFIHGKVEAIFTWEGGDSFSAFAIDDGVLTECEVVMTVKRKT